MHGVLRQELRRELPVGLVGWRGCSSIEPAFAAPADEPPAEDSPTLGKERNLYVGNLPWSHDDEALKELFDQWKPHRAEVVRYQDSGLSRGYGFVYFRSPELAESAREAMNGLVGRVAGRPGERGRRRSAGGAFT